VELLNWVIFGATERFFGNFLRNLTYSIKITNRFGISENNTFKTYENENGTLCQPVKLGEFQVEQNKKKYFTRFFT
jgi:hypothetical protein